MTTTSTRTQESHTAKLDRPLRVLFLCTANSARSQIAEAILAGSAAPDFEAVSAGSHPGSRVHPDAVRVLAERGIEWGEARPKGIDEVMDTEWDVIITVCDSARESCPVLPGQPIYAHWGIPDPAAIEDEEARYRAFREAAIYLARRIELMLALPIDRLEKRVLEQRLNRIASET